MKNSLYGFWLLLSLMITACKTGKQALGEIPNRGLEEVLQSLEKRNMDFKWFSAKASGDFDSPQFSGSGSMQLRIRKDSLIWMVGKKFSIEGFRTIINKDSFYLVNRLERFYGAEPLNRIHRMFGMRLYFEDMQELLAGNVLLPDTAQIQTYVQTGDKCLLSATIDEFEVTYTFEARALRLIALTMKDRYGRRVEAQFDDYKKLHKTFVPYQRNYTFFDETIQIAKLDVDVDEIEIDTPKSLNFSIPSHYERIRI